jgi:hypothetical protein
MMVFEENPTNIAVKYENRKIRGYFVMTETENVMIGIGDRIFNEDYIPSKKEFNKEDWDKWRRKFDYVYYRALGWQKRELEIRGIFYFLPYNMRGLKKITNINEAKESAIKIYEYIKKIENDKEQNPLYRKVRLKI